MKLLILSLSIVLLSGCGALDRFGAYLTGNASEECMNGVRYYQFTSGASVAYNEDGSVVKCK